jgi:hypothetical protein
LLEKTGTYTVGRVAESVEVLEHRIDELRSAVRRLVLAGDRAGATALRAELRRAEREWDEALAVLAEEAERTGGTSTPQATGQDRRPGQDRLTRQPGGQPHSLLPLREQVHHALTLLSVPAAPKLIVEVHAAFSGAGDITGTKLTHLRRDEERSYRLAPGARPYYLCSSLTAEHLAPARGLLAVSTWALEQRIVGPLSPRVDFLTAAIRVAEQAARMPVDNPAAARLIWRFAANIPGATAGEFDKVKPEAVAEAARAELAVHAEADRSDREAAAKRARTQLDDAGQLFGSRLRVLRGTA